MSTTPEVAPRSTARVVLWWAATLVVLVILDDLTFGPAFWALARWRGGLTALLAVYAIYVPAQIVLVRRATVPEPGRIAEFFLRRLDVQRKAGPIADNEERIRNRVIGAGSALVMTLVVAGVLPCLILWRRGYSRGFVRWMSLPTSILYATEFAVLHAVVPASV